MIICKYGKLTSIISHSNIDTIEYISRFILWFYKATYPVNDDTKMIFQNNRTLEFVHVKCSVFVLSHKTIFWAFTIMRISMFPPKATQVAQAYNLAPKATNWICITFNSTSFSSSNNLLRENPRVFYMRAHSLFTVAWCIRASK